MRSRSPRTTGPPRRPPRRATGGVDVFLLPAVVGGGLGDIEEVLAAGRGLARTGVPLFLFRLPDRPLPRSVDGPWDWPPFRRIVRLRPAGRAAVTIAPAWGVSAAPPTDGPFGRAGPWAAEAAAIEAAYGPDRTLHISLEEFARTLSIREEGRERLREGGVRRRDLGRQYRAATARGESATFAREFRRFRAFDRPNVLHLFAGFRPDPAFRREFPEAVVTGPLRPGRRRTSRAPSRGRRWIWYASPASAERIAPGVVAGLAAVRPRVVLEIRSPRPWRYAPPPATGTVGVAPIPAAEWAQRFRFAELRIVTGSRTLLEALEVGGPFLYFNGVLGAGPAMRRHRPEKIDALLRLARQQRRDPELLRDLADFARGRRVAAIVARAARHDGPWSRFPTPFVRSARRAEGDEAGRWIARAVRSMARPGARADVVVRSLRDSAPS